MRKSILLLSVLFVTFAQVFAQRFDQQKYLGHEQKEESLLVKTDKGVLYVKPYTEQVLKVTFLPNGTDTIAHSHSVVMKPHQIKFEVKDENNTISCSTSFYTAKIQKTPFQFSIEKNNEVILKHKPGIFFGKKERGFKFDYPKKEVLMGGGERAVSMDRRGQEFQLWNQPDYGYGVGSVSLNYGIPYVFSSEIYGVLFDNSYKGKIDFGKNDDKQWAVSFAGGELTYYFITGGTHGDVAENYAKLTGLQPLPPRWVLGNLTSRMAYMSEEEARDVVAKMQAEDFPMDAIILDLNWFGRFGREGENSMMGNLDWDKKYWPTGEQMIADFAKKNVKTVLITEPYFIETSTHYDFLKKNNLFVTNKKGESYYIDKFYFGKAGLIDIFKPEARDWFWKQYKRMIEQGVAGWWGDLGEPEYHTEDMNHVWGKAEAVHNIYGHYWVKTLADGYAKDFPEKRVFNLSRSGFAGSQHYNIFPWSGDVGRSWSGFKAQMPIMLSMCMSGIGYMHSDLGGFAMGEKDPELYTRWLQFGTFAPVFRPHGSKIPSEPIFWNDTTKNIVRETIKLRYRMLPYNYTLAWRNTQKGTPIVRPIWYNEPENTALYKIDDTYFWGENLLVAPVTEKGAKTRSVYLPKGNWFDFHTGEKLEGNQWAERNVDINSIPVFAKAGSFIPMTMDDFNSTDLYSPQKLSVRFYPTGEAGSKTEFTMYDDNGHLKDADKKGLNELYFFSASESEHQMTVTFDKQGGGYAGMPEQHQMEFVIYGIEKAPKKVSVNGTDLKTKKFKNRFNLFYGYFYDAKEKKLYVRYIYLGVNKYKAVVEW